MNLGVTPLIQIAERRVEGEAFQIEERRAEGEAFLREVSGAAATEATLTGERTHVEFPITVNMAYSGMPN